MRKMASFTKRCFYLFLSVCFLITFFAVHNNLTCLQRSVTCSNTEATVRSLQDASRIAAKLQRKIVIIYWTHAFNFVAPINADPFKWPFFYAGHNCPVDCELTTDKSRVTEASALVIHSGNPEEIPPKDLKNLTWILHTNENPKFAANLRDPDFMSQFNYAATYRFDSDFPCSQFAKPNLEFPVPYREKNGSVIYVSSHCEEVRTEYVRRLMKHIQVDSYGSCLNNKKGLSGRYSGLNIFHAVREMQRGYKFALIFANSDCDYYLTEKIYNALSASTIPVWMGTDKIDEVLQWGNLKHSVIKVRDFATPKKLAEYLHYLAGNETEYNTYLKWKYEGFQFPKEYYDSPIGVWWDGLPLYCRVCMKVAKDPKGHNGLPADKCDGDQKRTLEKWIKGE